MSIYNIIVPVEVIKPQLGQTSFIPHSLQRGSPRQNVYSEIRIVSRVERRECFIPILRSGCDVKLNGSSAKSVNYVLTSCDFFTELLVIDYTNSIVTL